MKLPRHNRHSGDRPIPLSSCVCLVFFILNSQLSTLNSQDIHFSQIDVNPILFVPAYSGFFDGNGRFGLSYRNQWASVSKAFQTVAATGEFSLMRRRYYGDGLSIGVILFSDRAGTLHYGTTAANLILSYYRAIGTSNNNFISLAMEAGMGQAGFSTDDIDMMEPDDNLEKTQSNFFSIGMGAAWFYQPHDDFYIKIGLSGRNLNRPNISYLYQDDAFIERKFCAYGRAEYRRWTSLSLLPLVAFMTQHNYMELMIGSDVKWYAAESGGQTVSLSAGARYRWRDALMAEFMLEYNAFLFALTYDANLSKLTPASHSVGAFELGIVYRLAKQHRVKRRAMPCPII